MKATLEYSLPEEENEHRDALNGTDWKLVVRNIDNMLRNALKHGHNLASADAALQSIRDVLQEELEQRGLYNGL